VSVGPLRLSLHPLVVFRSDETRRRSARLKKGSGAERTSSDGGARYFLTFNGERQEERGFREAGFERECDD